MVQIISQVICVLKFPRLVPIRKIAMVATQLQSEGKVIRQTMGIDSNFCQSFIFPFPKIQSITNPHANDHTTLVWLNMEFWKGIKEIPKQKL